MSILQELIRQDYGIVMTGSRWGHSENHDSLVYDSEKDIFYWNSQGLVGDAYHYLINVRKWSHNQAKDFLRTNGGNATFVHIVKNYDEVITYPPLVEAFHESLEHQDKSFFYARTITDETISRWMLGYYDGFYTIPIYQDGVFKQIQMRRDYPKKLIRKYYKGVGPLLFNSEILKITSKIFFVESPISAIVLNQNNIPAVSFDDGSQGFMPEWFKYFTHQKEIDICFDNDQAGELGALRIAKMLGVGRCKIYTFADAEIKGYGADDFFIDGNQQNHFLEAFTKNSKFAFQIQERKKWINK